MFQGEKSGILTVWKSAALLIGVPECVDVTPGDMVWWWLWQCWAGLCGLGGLFQLQ